MILIFVDNIFYYYYYYYYCNVLLAIVHNKNKPEAWSEACIVRMPLLVFSCVHSVAVPLPGEEGVGIEG